MYEAEIQAAIDRQLLIERKAAAWDELTRRLADPSSMLAGAHFASWVDGVWVSVHPTETLPKR